MTFIVHPLEASFLVAPFVEHLLEAPFRISFLILERLMTQGHLIIKVKFHHLCFVFFFLFFFFFFFFGGCFFVSLSLLLFNI